jgi:DUF4097 and DUF4098 domain-containing protein YvlB
MIRNIVLLVLVCSVGTQLTAQTHTEKINKEFTFEKKGPENALMIANVNGNIKVQAYDGATIQVEVTKSIRAKTQERLEKGKTELNLGVIDLADTIILYINGLCTRFNREDRRKNKFGNTYVEKRWSYSWEHTGQDCHESYDHTMDFTVKIPAALNIIVGTINNGDIVIENVKGAVTANNINGSIRLTNLMREAEASTINGDLDVVYAQNPQRNCRFYSLNGDINASFQKGLVASMSFESFNGSFYTNIDRLERLPVEVEKKPNDKGTKYKVSDNRYKIGTGNNTAFLDFETFNGNVYLREKMN